MASNKTTDKNYRTEMKGFFGINRSKSSDEWSCDQIQNFRLDPSGALVKRPGRKKLLDFNYPVSSAISFPANSENRSSTDIIVAAPPYVHAVGLESGEDYIIYHDTGDSADLAVFGSSAYLFDGLGIKIYNVEENQMQAARGYAPLYGKGWHPSELGDVFEEPNLICGDLRINYKIKEDTERVYFGFSAYAVNRVEINGKLANEYTYGGSYISGVFPKGSTVDVWLTRPFPESPLIYCRNARIVGGGADERLVVYGHSSEPSRVFCSRPVSKGEFDRAKRGFQSSCDLYFPESLSFDLGTRKVVSVCSCADSAVIFSESSTQLLKFNGSESELYTLSDSVGCVSSGASASKQKGVYTISKSGIYRFTVDLSTPYYSKLEKLSALLGGENDLIIDESCSILDNDSDGELWFSCGQTVFIYNTDFDRFYSYAGMKGTDMFRLGNSLLFFEDSYLWEFSDDYFCDICDGEESTIFASIKSRWLDFGDISEQKKSLTVYPFFKMQEGEYLMLGVQTDSELSLSLPIFGDNSISPDLRAIRVARCRFHSFIISLTSYDTSRPKIFGVAMTAQ